MSTFKKSDLLKSLKNSYVNFYSKDLERVIDIFFNEIKQALHKGENCEIRNFGTYSTHIQKARTSRNPRTGEKIETLGKLKIKFKMSKKLFNKINNIKNNE